MMSTTTAENPLAKYFRVPGLTVKLPTGGVFFPQGAINLGTDGTLEVYPMRAADELLLKNPDALMSGYAIEKLIESCVPGIKAPRLISSPDLDLLLLAVRAATYGEVMEIQAACPKCHHMNTFDCNLPLLIENMKPCPTDTSVRLTDDIVVKLRPYNLANQTRLSLKTFEETRKVQALDAQEATTAEMRTAQMNASMQVLADLTSEMMAECVTSIVTPDGEVSEREFISEFFGNISGAWTKKIESTLEGLNRTGIDKTLHVQCQQPKCKNEWNTTVEFDPSNFFDSGSSD